MATASSTRSSPTRNRRKRNKAYSPDRTGSSSAEDTVRSPNRATTSKTSSKRGRGRPPTIGQYVGLTAAKEAHLKAQREEWALLAEKEIMESVRNLRVKENSVAGSTGEPRPDPENRLEETAKLAVTIAAKSGNLKGTYVRALKEMAFAIREAKEEMAARTTDGENKRLQELCSRQEAEILHMKKAIADMRSEIARLAHAVGSPAAVPAPAPIQRSDDEEERRLQRIMRAVGTMLDARFAVMEARLPPEPRLRPPLAADHSRSRAQEKTPTPATAAESMPTPEPTAAVATAAPNGGGPQKKKAPKNRQQPAPAEPRTFPPAPAALTEAWTTVARRGAKPRTATATGTVPAPPPLKEKKKRLRPPRSQAVIVKLQPEAIERGVTYRSVLAEARAKIDPAELGIPIQRIRSAVTGAKVLVVDGADQYEKADLLANKLREVLPSDSIVVSRPTITAAVRLSGLDESISREELGAAVARIGECPPDTVKVGEIKMGPGGTGQVVVRCPIAGVKRILAVDKLRIGWSVLRAQLLEARAQDLLIQSMAERLTHLAVVAEPYRVPSVPDWAGDVDGLVAVVQRRSAVGAPPEFDVVQRGRGYVAVFWAGLLVVGVGREMEEWLVESGLVVLNRGAENTCVRRSGGSVVDVSFATPDVARRVRGWKVLSDVETLSDHRYIRFRVAAAPESSTATLPFDGGAEGPRWALKRLDVERLQEAAVVQAWRLDSLGEPAGVCEGAERLREAMSRVCDHAMPRVRAYAPRRQVYWWNVEIAGLRRRCAGSRRRYQHLRRRRRRDEEEEDRAYEAYRVDVRALRVAIGEAKEAAWKELLETLDRDPWGRPYHIARSTMRPWAPPTTSTLPPDMVRHVVGGLFPSAPEIPFVPPVMSSARDGARAEEDDDVSPAEFDAAVEKMKLKRTAPGPDGIPNRAWALALKMEGGLGPVLRGLFSRCLREGRFPAIWKKGKLVLIPKEGRPRDQPSGYRPIVVLDEAGKLLERVVASRLVQHLENQVEF
ncbi:uncharacterized protein LOC134199210 [Bombyx mori]|uniref:uncharacterized protein LOC134199210 n=1 Tax=Bombyx mori TaxID=7091 RepID=UPI002ED1143B